MQVPPWVKPACWGAVAGAVTIMIVGFSWGGWTTGSTAQRLASERADAAVVAALTPFCVANFLQQPDAAVKLADLQKTSSSYSQSQVLVKGGWATLEGSKEPNYAVARACAEALTTPKT
jgi:pimeloyl-ACP methyl ester carboxylesterase